MSRDGHVTQGWSAHSQSSFLPLFSLWVGSANEANERIVGGMPL